MAKQQPNTPEPKKSQDEPELIVDADAGAPKKTQLAKKSSEPTQLAKKSPQPTQLAPESRDAQSKPPRLEIEGEDIVEAEAVESDVVEAQPVSDVVEAQPASDVAEAMAVDSGVIKSGDEEHVFTADEMEAHKASAAQAAPETPVKAEQPVEAEEIFEDAIGGELPGGRSESSSMNVTLHKSARAGEGSEDAIGGEAPRGRAESSMHVKGKKTGELEKTETFDGLGEPAEELERTATFEGAADDGSSAVDLGRRPAKKGSSTHAGIDEVAEELESGVKLLPAESPTSKRKPGPSGEHDDLVTEEVEMPGGPLTGKTKKVKKTKTDTAMPVRKFAEGEDLRSDSDKTVDEDAAAELWKETEESKTESAKEEPSTPAPGAKEDKAPAAEKPDEEAADETAAAPAPRRRAGVAARPPRKPKYGRRLLGGVAVGLFVAIVAVISLRYFDPDLLESAFAGLPGTKQPKAAVELKSAQAALKQEHDQLTAARNEKDELERNLDAKTAENKKLSEQMAGLAANEKIVGEVRDVLAKKMIIDAKTDVKDLGKAINQTLAAKEAKEKLLADIEKNLADAKLLDKLDLAAIGTLVKDAGDQQAAVAAVNKLLDDAKIKEQGAKGVQQLLASKKDLDDKLTEFNKLLGAEKVKGEGVAGLKEIVALRNQLQKDRDELDKAISAAYQELAAGQFVPATGNPRQQLLEGAKLARQRAESPLTVPLAQLAAKVADMGLSPAANTKKAFEAAALLAELNYYRLREPLVQSPQQKLDIYLSVYQRRSKGDATEQAAALKDAAWVLSKDAKASATARAKAHAVRGLILRNQEKFDEARYALQAAVAAAPAGAGPWAAQAKTALAELTDPTAYYLPYIGELHAGGLADLAKQELASALKAMPGDGRLLAQRALFHLQEARITGKFAADAQAAVRKDADAAMKNPKTASEGSFVLGLLEEELGNYAQAEQQFRKALKTHQGSADEAARYRIALARVLQRERAPTAAPAPPPKKQQKKADDDKEVRQAFPLAVDLLIGQIAPDDEENPAVAARLNESVKLAKELIASANPKIKGQGHMLLGQALAKQGLRTEGVREYLKGIEMLFPGMASKEMIQLVNEHPAFQQADAAKAPSAYLAEVHFGKGLHYFWSRQYPEAEDQLRQAAGFYSHDARYLYYLGMAQYAQKTKVKRDAANLSFEKAAKLEAENRPSASEINASLERVQGDLRKLINSFRTKAIELRN